MYVYWRLLSQTFSENGKLNYDKVFYGAPECIFLICDAWVSNTPIFIHSRATKL